MKILFYFILCMAIAFLGVQLYRLVSQEYALKKDFEALAQKTEAAGKENKRVEMQLSALKNEGNIERELRRAGYAAPGEKVFIIVPKNQ